MISDRPYRPPLIPYRAMEEVIKCASTKKLDSEVIKGLLNYCSLFPIGSWVELDNGLIARVVASNGKQFAKPVVRPLFDAKTRKRLERNGATESINLAKDAQVKILRAIDGRDLNVELMEGF